MADDSPKERPTVDIEKPPAWAVTIIEKVGALDRRTQAFANDLTDMHEDVRRIKADQEEFRADVCNHLHDLDTWRKGTSDRVRSESDVNLKQSADIAAVLQRVDNLGAAVQTATSAQTVAIFQRIDEASKTPLGRKVLALASMLLSLALAYLAGKGIK